MKFNKTVEKSQERSNVKEMVYQATRKKELLDSGKCCNYNYYILNLGTHPTAYIEIPKYHKCYMKHYDDVNISVHGGLTYSEDHLYIDEKQKLDNSWFIGWDYAHFDDYLGYEEMYPLLRTNGKKWTTKEIQDEILDVCKQLEKIVWKDVKD